MADMKDTAKTKRRRIANVKIAPSKLMLNPQLDKVRSKARLGIRGKILIPFLALVFISVGVISAIAVRSIYEVGHRASVNSFSMGEEVVRTSIAALEDLGRVFIQRRATYVAREIGLYI